MNQKKKNQYITTISNVSIETESCYVDQIKDLFYHNNNNDNDDI